MKVIYAQEQHRHTHARSDTQTLKPQSRTKMGEPQPFRPPERLRFTGPLAWRARGQFTCSFNQSVFVRGLKRPSESQEKMIVDVLLACLLVSIYLLAKQLVYRKMYKLPPGPFGLPFLGYTPFLSKDPHSDFLKMHEKYGPTFGLHIGHHYTVVMADYADIKEAFNKEEFTYRQPKILEISENYDNVAQMNGLAWRENRRLTLTALRNLGAGKSRMEEVVQEEIAVDLDILEKMPPDEEINLSDFFHRALTNTYLSIVSGRTNQDDRELFDLFDRLYKCVNKRLDTHRMAYIFSGLSPLTKLLGPLREKFYTTELKEAENYFWEKIESREKLSEQNLLENFVDYYIREADRKKGKETSFTRENLLGNAIMLVYTGSDTLKSKLLWLFLSLAEYQDKQEKLYREIIHHIGPEKSPTWNDRDQLPYTMAFLMEVMRCKTIPSTIDHHWAVNEGTISGFYIPKNTVLSANITAVHFDERLWGDPKVFRPERFLSEDGTKIIQPEYWIPFLPGKRSCPADKLSMMQLFLLASSFVQRLQILPPKTGLSVEGQAGASLYARKPFVRMRRRD